MKKYMLFAIVLLFSISTTAQFVSKTGDEISKGDTLVIGKASSPLGFEFITQGNVRMHPSHAGKTIVITGSKEYGGKTYLSFKGFGLLPVYLDFDNAIETGEIINPSASITREQAIQQLKEAKELLDLEIITQQKYDSLKLVLTPVIIKK